MKNIDTIVVSNNFTEEQLAEQRRVMRVIAGVLGVEDELDMHWAEHYFFNFRDMIVEQLAKNNKDGKN